MQFRKPQQSELFDDRPRNATPALPPGAQEEAKQVLTQWLHAVYAAMIQEPNDDQDRH